MHSSSFFLAALASASFFASSSAMIQPISNIDFWPGFTSPVGGETWAAGSTQSASWDQSHDGYDLEDIGQTADIVLGYTDDASPSLHLNWVLASDVPLYGESNSVSFTLPEDLPYRSTYFLVLLGSTSDRSQKFTITPTTIKGLLGIGGNSPDRMMLRKRTSRSLVH